MIRHTFKTNNPNKVASEIGELLGCPARFIVDSFNSHRSTDTKFNKVRYFERYQQQHATVHVDRSMSPFLDQWLSNIKTYPPSEIFFEKYGKEAKAEQRIQTICEDLYRFCYPEGEENLLGELSASYRELQVLWIMGFDDIKPEPIQKAAEKFLKYAKLVLPALEAMHKKDQLLNEYYKPIKVKFQDISTEVYNLTKEYK